MNTTPMTIQGAQDLETERAKLVNNDRKEIITAIATAREHGDLKENAEYHAAKEQQSFVEGRILEIESKLSSAQIIDITTLSSQENIVFGATVSLEEVNTGINVSYQIVGEDEADISIGKISYLSPIARALIGKELDDEVVVKAPKGDIIYEVQDIKYI